MPKDKTSKLVSPRFTKEFQPELYAAPEQAPEISPAMDSKIAEARRTSAENSSFTDTVLYSLAGGTKGINAIGSFSSWVYSRFNRPNVVDTNFELDKELPTLLKDLPIDTWHRFKGASSLEDARAIKDEIETDMFIDSKIAAAGYKGVAATLLSSIGDIDTVLPMVSLGKAGRLARAAETSLNAGIANVATESAMSTIKDNSFNDVLEAGVFGVGLGFMLGGTLPPTNLRPLADEAINSNIKRQTPASSTGFID